MSLSHLFTIFLLTIPFVFSIPSLYRIDTNSNGLNNTLTLQKGRYHPLSIEIHSVYGNYDKKLQTTILTLSDRERFIMPYDHYYINTSDTLSIRTYIGVNCTAEFTEEELTHGLTLQFLSENESFESQNISVYIITDPIKVNLTNTDNTLGPLTYGIFYPVDPLFNTNPLTIEFDVVDAQYKSKLLLNGKSIQIQPTIDHTHHYTQSTRYYVNDTNITEDVINNIQIKASINDNTCYTLSPNSTMFEINIHKDKQISNIQNTSLTIVWYFENNTMYLSSIENDDNIVEGAVSCVILANELQMIVDSDITNQIYPDDITYNNKIAFFKTNLGDNHKSFKVPLLNLNKYSKYKWKCIYENNAFSYVNRKSITLENNILINAPLSIIGGYPSCWDVLVKNMSQPIIFEEHIGRYASLNVLEGGREDYNENGCLKFDFRNIDGMYSDNTVDDGNGSGNVTAKSFCVYSEPTCNVSKFDWESISDTVYNNFTSRFINETAISNEFGVAIPEVIAVKQVDYIGMNSSLIKVKSKSLHNETHMRLTLENVHTEPVECYYHFERSSEHVDMVNMNLIQDKTITLQPSTTDSADVGTVLLLSFDDAENFNNKKYTLNLLCNSLIGFELTSTTDNPFTSMHLIHSANYSFDCEHSNKSIYCIEQRTTHQEFNDLSVDVEGINNVLKDIETFKKKSFTAKESTLSNAVINLQNKKKAILMFPFAIKVDEYMTLMDCSEVDYLDECLRGFKHNEQIVMDFVMKTIYNDTTNITEFIMKFANDNTTKDILELIMIKTLTLGNAAKALDKDTSKQTLNLTISLLKEYNTILNVIETLYKEDSDYDNIINDIVVLYFRAISSMQNVIKYMDVQDYVTTPGSSANDFFIQDEIITQYVNILSSSLINILLKTNHSEIDNDDYLYKYIHFDINDITTTTTTYDIINDTISMNIPVNDLVNDNVVGMPVLVYKSYPSISDLQSNETFLNEVIGVNIVKDNAVSVSNGYQLQTGIEIIYNRTALGLNVSYCYIIKDGVLTNKQVNYTINEDENTFTCYISETGDVLVSVYEIQINNNNDFPWLIMFIIVCIAVVLIILIVVGYKKLKKKQQPEINANLDKLFIES